MKQKLTKRVIAATAVGCLGAVIGCSGPTEPTDADLGGSGSRSQRLESQFMGGPSTVSTTGSAGLGVTASTAYSPYRGHKRFDAPDAPGGPFGSDPEIVSTPSEPDTAVPEEVGSNPRDDPSITPLGRTQLQAAPTAQSEAGAP